jgi:phospholipid/cholesterol/gamma-HCH transport system substrate-binding protein
MPSAKKVRWSQLKVGIMAMIALALLGFLVFLMTGEKRFFATNVRLYTYLDDSYAITPAAPVRLNGILAGKISKVELSGDPNPSRVIRVEMEVDEQMLANIPTDSLAAVASANVLGTKYINIKRGQGQTMVEPGGEIGSIETRGIEDVVASGHDTMTAARNILRRLEAIILEIEGGRGSIGKFLKDETLYNNLAGTVTEAHKLTQALNRGEGTIGRLIYEDELYQQIRGTMARLDNIINDVQQGQGTAGKLLKDPALYEETRKTVAEIRLLVADLNAGKGTAGKLLKDEQLHTRINSATAKLDALLAKINAGEGTLGQLVVNPQLYESMNGASYELHQLMKDFRANPKKFLRIQLSLF